MKLTVLIILSYILLSSTIKADTRTFIKGIDVPVLMDSILKNGKAEHEHVWFFGVIYNCININDKERVGTIRVAVYKDDDESKTMFKRHLMIFSSLQGTDFTASIGDECAVNRNWVIFRRDNVVINLDFKENQMSIAKAVDKKLVNGENGVIRGTSPLIPVIKSYIVQPGLIKAVTEPVMDGYTSSIDLQGHPHYVNEIHYIDSIIFATKHCVMAKPFKCDREELKRKMDFWKAQEEEKRRPPEAVVKKHLETLASGNLDFEARKEAILVLGASKDKRAEPVLIVELDRLDRDPPPNPVLCLLAIRALGMLRTPKAATRIAAILHAPPVGNVEDEGEFEGQCRREAASALSLIGGETARKAFEAVVKAPREYRSVRETAGNALRNMK